MATTLTTTRPTGASPSSALSTRRLSVQAFLALAGAAAATAVSTGGAIPMPAPDPDAELHASAAAFREVDEAISIDAILPDKRDPAAEARTEALCRRRDGLMDTVTDLDPQTLSGLSAKAQVMIAVFDRDVATTIGATVEDEAEPYEWLAYRLAHDVVALAGVKPWPEHPARAVYVRQYEEMLAEQEANPPPLPEWRVKADAESARLRALGLRRDGGLTMSDHQLVAWLARRAAAEHGMDMAERIIALSTMAREKFGPDFAYKLEHLA